MKTFINKVGWYDMLTLDHKVCRVCFSQPHLPGQTPTARAMAAAEGRPLNDTNLAAYRTSLRAWLKRHITSAHPEWVNNVRWDEGKVRSNMPVKTEDEIADIVGAAIDDALWCPRSRRVDTSAMVVSTVVTTIAPVNATCRIAFAIIWRCGDE